MTACSSSNGGGESTGADPVKITVAEQGNAGFTTGLYPHLAQELGYFADEGIEIEKFVSVTKGSDAVAGMVAGSIQVSHIGPEGITAKSKGADVVGIAATFDASIWSVLANKQITSWSDLKGKTIALGSLSDITAVVFDKLAAAAGLDPKKDLKYVALGATPQRVAAVENGQAAATLATYPTVSAAMSKGTLTNLGFAPQGDSIPRLIATDVEASGEWARQNPDVVERYLKAIIRTVDYLKNPDNKSAAVDKIAGLTKDSPEAIADGLDAYMYDPAAENAYFPDDYHHGEGVFDATVDDYMSVGLLDKKVSESDYMDYSYVDKALQDS